MDAADFRTWCTVRVPVPTGGHHAGLIESFDDATGVATLAAALPGAYAESAALARLAHRMGKTAVAKFLSNLLPITAAARSGDLGEILATAYLHEEGRWVVGPSRLIHRDHQEWAMRGDDVLGAKIDAEGKALIIKAEAKSRIRMDSRTVTDARDGLARNEEMPSPHSLAQFAKRLESTPDEAVSDAIVDLQLLDGIRPDRVAHLMFLFTSSDPSSYVTADLQAYAGAVPQLTITLRVQGHREFIADAYDGVIADGS